MLADEKYDLERIIRWLETNDEKAWSYYLVLAEQVSLDVLKKMEPQRRLYKSSSRSAATAVYDPNHEQARESLPHIETLVRALRHQIRQAAPESAREAVDCMR